MCRRKASPPAPNIPLETLARRVGALCRIDPDALSDKSRKAHLVEARSLFCFWAVRNLGYPATTVASFLGITQPGVGYAAGRDEAIARDKNLIPNEA